MSEFLSSHLALALLLPLALTLLFLFRRQWGEQRLRRHFSARVLKSIALGKNPMVESLGALSLVLAMVLIVLGLMRPQGEEIQTAITKSGKDVIILLDISRSMLAEDLRPNRLERAKHMLYDLVDRLEGERIALLSFSGSLLLKSPLTRDYNYFKNIAKRLSTEEINKGGTRIGDAIRLSLKRLFFDDKTLRKDLILITDGEDQESDPLGAAREAAAQGVRIHVLGLGSLEGTTIPDGKGGVITHRGSPVITALKEDQLKEIARITKGVYLPVRTRLADLGELYRDILSQLPDQPTDQGEEAPLKEELFYWFLWPALGLLLLEGLLCLPPIRGKTL